jgi:hypothetical protein
MENTEYLGDGVYATYDSYAITLTTGSHLEEEADTIIWLEPEVVEALLRFIRKHTEVKKDDSK